MTATSTAQQDVQAPRPRARLSRSRWQLSVITFICGAIAGAGITFKLSDDRTLDAMKRPGPNPERIIEDLKSELKLSPEQAEAVAKIVREHDAKMQEMHREMLPRFDADVRHFEDQISSVLDDGQKALWQARIERMHSMFPRKPTPTKSMRASQRSL